MVGCVVTRWGLAALLCAAAPAAAGAQQVLDVMPRGGQRGTEVGLALLGRQLEHPRDLLFHKEGIEVVEIASVNDRKVSARVRIASDCPLGEHPFQLVTARGLGDVMTLHVGVLPEVAEDRKKGANGPEEAQPIPFPCTVNGTLDAEDLDRYAVDLPAGRITLEVEGLRLGGIDCDPRLVLRDAQGRVVKLAEDSALGRMDPFMVVDVAVPGRFVIELRETAWGGSSLHHYRLHAGTFPRPAGALPTGGRPGEVLTLRYLGAGGGFSERLHMPRAAGEVVPWFPAGPSGIAPTPILLALSDLPEVVEPADGAAGEPVPFAPPCAVSGILAGAGEEDAWRFEAKKGRRVRFQVEARALRSPLDAVITVRDASGRTLAGNDDAGGPDGRLDFRPPADGSYTLHIRDLLGRGGPSWFYRVTADAPGPGTRTRIESTGYQQPRWLAVPRGGRMGTVLVAEGFDRNAHAALRLEGLPPGVVQEPAPVHPSSSRLPIVLAAAPDASLGACLARVGATLGDDPEVRDAGFAHDVPLVRVENNRVYLTTTIRRLPVVVVESLPFRVEAEPPSVPLVRGSALGLKVRVLRDDGFKGNVRLGLLNDPVGIRSGTVDVAGDRSEGVIPISHAGGMPDEPWRVVVLATADAGGPVATCSDVVQLPVVSPYYIARPGKARGFRGQEVALPVSLEMREPFQGKVLVQIPNLPRGVTAEIPEVDETSTGLECSLHLADDAALGRHRNLLFLFRVPVPGGIAVQQVRGGELRIDPPRPATGTAAPKVEGKRAWGTVANPKT